MLIFFWNQSHAARGRHNLALALHSAQDRRPFLVGGRARARIIPGEQAIAHVLSQRAVLDHPALNDAIERNLRSRCACGRSENVMNLITTYLLFIVIPVTLGSIVNFLTLLLIVNADLVWPDLAHGGRQ